MMKRNLLFEGFLLGCGVTAILLSFVLMPMVERNKDFGMDMSDLYIAALDDISTLTKICGSTCENVTLKYPKLHSEIMSKPVK